MGLGAQAAIAAPFGTIHTVRGRPDPQGWRHPVVPPERPAFRKREIGPRPSTIPSAEEDTARARAVSVNVDGAAGAPFESLFADRTPRNTEI